MHPIGDDTLAKVNEYVKLRDNKPADSDGEEKIQEWQNNVQRTSQLAIVINGCQVPWINANGPWNQGYIKDFWEKLDNGKAWDPTIERKAGGVALYEGITMDKINLTVSSTSSVMSLIRAVVGQYQRTGTVEQWLLDNFLSIRVNWLLESTVEEIGTLNIAENIEQATRKKTFRD